MGKAIVACDGTFGIPPYRSFTRYQLRRHLVCGSKDCFVKGTPHAIRHRKIF